MGRWIVNSAWPYVNSVPHLGTFIHLLSADVYTRYLRLKGEDVIAVTGSDEHGTPIEVEALRKGINPKKLTDKYHNLILELLKKYSISFDNYSRTESPTHIQFSQSFYRKLYENNHITKKTVELPYCDKCSRFLPDRFVEGKCPYCEFESARGDQCDNCGRVLDPTELIDWHCVFCGSKPTIQPSTHWFFELPRFEKDIKNYLINNEQLPENAKNFSLRWIQEGLKPRALTRDNKWGVPSPFPGSEGKTIYVWMEAVLGYLSASIEFSENKGNPDLWKEYWKDKQTKNVHFIGKDNIPFHTIIFPALLIASEENYVLPWQVSSTEFILYEGQGKFSKSRRIGVWMDEALEVAEPEYWRYVLISIRPEMKDANFTWREFERHINTELNDILGNFVHRTLTFVKSNFESRIPEVKDISEQDKEIIAIWKNVPSKVGDLMDRFRLKEALFAVVDLARSGNEYMSRKEPWHLIKNDEQAAANTINVCSQLVRNLAIILYPFLPRTSQLIWKQLALEEDVSTQNWFNAGEMQLPSGHKIGKPKPLFHKVDSAEIMKNWKPDSGAQIKK
ncbi:methionine--tRNA ligase [[Eubacterium] cellulosolvens]